MKIGQFLAEIWSYFVLFHKNDCISVKNGPVRQLGTLWYVKDIIWVDTRRHVEVIIWVDTRRGGVEVII